MAVPNTFFASESRLFLSYPCMKPIKMNAGTASAFVIANMIGTGVFTSLGFQLLTTANPISIALIWLIGGFVALCGAIVYSELGAAMPRSGGEYHYLSQIYHPAVGFLSGWTSLIVGFSAPIALSCMALSSYVCNIWPVIPPKLFAMIMLTVITLFHAFSMKVGANIQNVLTIVKVLVIVVFILAGLYVSADGVAAGNFQTMGDFSIGDMFTAGFAVSLIWVYYAYSGWNAAAYIANDIKHPRKNIPLALMGSTLFTIVLYLGLNMIFLRTTPISEMNGQIEIGLISARHIFGAEGGEVMGLLIAVMLVSSISSMVFVGPRVATTMGEDHRILRGLTRKNPSGCPYVAIWAQWLLSGVMVLTGAFQEITQYTSVVLSLCALLTVMGVIRHRRKFPNAERPYRTLLYPVPALLFGIIISWSIIYMLYTDFCQYLDGQHLLPWTTLLSLGTLLFGYVVYLLSQQLSQQH